MNKGGGRRVRTWDPIIYFVSVLVVFDLLVLVGVGREMDSVSLIFNSVVVFLWCFPHLLNINKQTNKRTNANRNWLLAASIVCVTPISWSSVSYKCQRNWLLLFYLLFFLHLTWENA